MREVCFEVNDELYGSIQKLRGAGVSLYDIVRAGVERLTAEKFKPKLITYSMCGEVRQFKFRWPEGIEVYDNALCFNVNGDTYYIAYCMRRAFGSERRRVVVFRVSRRGKTMRAIAEFAGTDDWQDTKLVAALVKKPDNKYARPDEIDKIPEYTPLKDLIKDHGSVIKGGKKGFAALVVREDDYEKILYYAVRRYEMMQG